MNTLETENLSGKNHSTPHINNPLKYLTATSIIGDKVFNPDGEKIGSIKDIMVDMSEGRIEYVVVELGGFLGIGEKYFAVPFASLKVDAKNQVFRLSQEDQLKIKDAPGFDKDHWPKTNSHEFDHAGEQGGFMGVNTGAVPYSS